MLSSVIYYRFSTVKILLLFFINTTTPLKYEVNYLLFYQKEKSKFCKKEEKLNYLLPWRTSYKIA